MEGCSFFSLFLRVSRLAEINLNLSENINSAVSIRSDEAGEWGEYDSNLDRERERRNCTASIESPMDDEGIDEGGER